MILARYLGRRRAIAALVVLLFTSGCHRYTAAERDNRRVLDEVLTAIAIKNARLLDESTQRWQARHAAGDLSDEDFTALSAVIEQARHGDWPGAEAAGNAFRKRRPFVPSGQ